MELELYDRIVIENCKDALDLMKWIRNTYCNEEVSIWHVLCFQELPFEKFNIDFEYKSKEQRLFCEKVDEQIMIVHTYVRNENNEYVEIFKYKFNYIICSAVKKLDFAKNLSNAKIELIKKQIDEKEYITYTSLLIMTIVFAASNKIDYIECKEIERHSITKKEAKRNRVDKDRPLSLIRKVYLFNKKKDFSKIRHHKSPECEFGVRGHWRNQKSGKKIWIKPYRKCKGKGNCTGKIYVV